MRGQECLRGVMRWGGMGTLRVSEACVERRVGSGAKEGAPWLSICMASVLTSEVDVGGGRESCWEFSGLFWVVEVWMESDCGVVSGSSGEGSCWASCSGALIRAVGAGILSL